MQLIFKLYFHFVSDGPKFSQPIPNNTVAVGREAILACSVEGLGTYKVNTVNVALFKHEICSVR